MTFEWPTFAKSTIAIAALAFGVGQAQATTFDVSLSGLVANATTASFDVGTTHFDQWILALSLDSSTPSPLEVTQGDTINANITLDGPVTVPTSVTLTSFLFGMSGASFPSGDTGTSGSTDFFLSGSPIKSGTGTTSSSGWVPNGVVFFPPDNGSFTFDSLVSTYTLDTFTSLGVATTILDNATMYYTLFSPASVPPTPAPEPETGALLLAGLGILGMAARRRKTMLR